MRIVIIGGGLSGLAAAYALCQKTENQVTVLEKSAELGGMLKSYACRNYHIEEYYHHFFANDQALIALLEELSLDDKIRWRPAKNGYYIHGKIYPIDTPLDFLKLPGFTVKDLVRLALLTVKIKNFRQFETLDRITAKEWVIENSNANIWENFVAPLLESKFGKNSRNISAAWFVKRIQIRSNRKWNGETLGYLDGGFRQLIEKLKAGIEARSGKIFLNMAAQKIVSGAGETKKVMAAGKEFEADKIIFTGSEGQFRKIKEGFGREKSPIKYQGTVCALLSFQEKLMRDIYWLNIRDADIPFRVLIEHTNFIPASGYDGEHLVYLTYYFQDADDEIAKMENSRLIDLYLEKIRRMFPHSKNNRMNWYKIKKEFPTAPVYETGYLKSILPYQTKKENLYYAGINSFDNYPERSIQGSIMAGINISKFIQNSQ